MQIHIDFETYSESDLKKKGAWNYSRDETTKVICMGISSDDNDPVLFTDEDKIKKVLKKYLVNSDNDFYAWNSFFECCIIQNVLGINIESFKGWNDVMAWACASALPQSLGDCSKVFFPKDKDSQKDKEGKSLISKLCMPQKISWLQLTKAELWKKENPKDADILIKALEIKAQSNKEEGKSKTKLVNEYMAIVEPYSDFRVHPKYKHENYEELIFSLGEYCKQDVLVEKKLSQYIRPLSDTEKLVWIEDQKINWKGIKCDTGFCKKSTFIFEDTKKKKLHDIKLITGLDNPNSPAQLSKWLNQYIEIDNLQAPTIRELLLDEELPSKVRKVLQLRSSCARTPPKKYVSMVDRADSIDQRIRSMLAYHAASTGRWASRGINVQNLPRPTLKQFQDPVNLILKDETELLEMCYGDSIEVLCSLIRCSLIPSEGNILVVSDYSSIEARVLAWLATANEILKVFRTHGKVYEYTASQIYNKPISKINKDERFVGKTATLALGYQGGKAAFLRMANAYGVELPEELAEKTVKKWRKANSKIVNLWYDTQKKAISAMLNKGKVIKVNEYISFKFVYYKSKPYLLCKLPSGRLLTYVNPKLKQGKYGNQLTYMGINSFTRQWERIDTYGGKLIENITQAVARDVLANAKLNLVGTDYDNVVLSVHDEIICDTPIEIASSDKLSEIMCALPEWAKGLPVSAEGEVTTRYWK